jgi:TnpA family transposase
LPVEFLSQQAKSSYGQFTGDPSENDLTRYFYLDETDLIYINKKRNDSTRLGFALQLATVRYLGTFLDNPLDVPDIVTRTISRQLGIEDSNVVKRYAHSSLQWKHTNEIRELYGYVEITNHRIGLRFTRWLYNLCWIGNERPAVLFERARIWMLVHKVLLPSCVQLERYISHLKSRVEKHLWESIVHYISPEQKTSLEKLLEIPEGGHTSLLVILRKSPVRRSSRSLKEALERINSIRALGINLSLPIRIPQARVKALGRVAEVCRMQTLERMESLRRLATLAAFLYCLEAAAQDDAMELLEIMLNTIFNKAVKANKDARLRTMGDMDQKAGILAEFCLALTNSKGPVLKRLSSAYKVTSKDELTEIALSIKKTIRPPNDVYYQELDKQYRSARIFLPTLLEYLRVGATPGGKPLLLACQWLKEKLKGDKTRLKNDAPSEIVGKAWQKHVFIDKDTIDLHAYAFCVLDGLRKAIPRREIFAMPGWRYSDPRIGLLSGPEWETMRPILCRTLSLSAKPEPTLSALSKELDMTYRAVADRLPQNTELCFKNVKGKRKLSLSPLDALDEPDSLIKLRKEVQSRLPRVGLPEILLEIAIRTGFTDAFTHISEKASRASDLYVSLCAVLMSEACNIGLQPLIQDDSVALKKDRLAWTLQNYIRSETLTAANSILVSAHNKLDLPHRWGGGEIASADGIRFTVPVRTIHGGYNPKYFGRELGLTWYNLLSDIYAGLNGIVVPGTLRDSLILLAVVLEQDTDLQPTTIMTDTGAYSDVVFGLFRLLGCHFSPRMADIGDSRFWRIDPKAEYGDFDKAGLHKINLQLITQQWDDILRLIGSLKLGKVSPKGIMQMLRLAGKPTKLAQAIREIGWI